MQKKEEERQSKIKAKELELRRVTEMGKEALILIKDELKQGVLSFTKKVETVVIPPFIIGGSAAAHWVCDCLLEHREELDIVLDMFEQRSVGEDSSDMSSSSSSTAPCSETRSPARKKTRIRSPYRKKKGSTQESIDDEMEDIDSGSLSSAFSEKSASESDESLDVDEEGSEEADKTKAVDVTPTCDNVYEDQLASVIPSLVANDFDIYVGGEWGDDFEMSKEKGACTYPEVKGFEKDEVNIVKCIRLSSEGFLQNNDINATAVCIEVEDDDINYISLHVSPHFWEFFFSSEKERVLKATRTGLGMRTFIRLAYKSYEMKIPFLEVDTDGVNLWDMNETIFSSHTKKVEEMNKEWELSPFRYCKINKAAGGYRLERVIQKLDCANCKVGKANKKCVQLFCSRCCKKTDKKCGVHKKKSKNTGKEKESNKKD